MGPHWPGWGRKLEAGRDSNRHQAAEGAVQRGAVEDGGGADYEAQHDQAVDDEVLEGVPPVGNGQVVLNCGQSSLPGAEHLLLVGMSECPHEGGA